MEFLRRIKNNLEINNKHDEAIKVNRIMNGDFSDKKFIQHLRDYIISKYEFNKHYYSADEDKNYLISIQNKCLRELKAFDDFFRRREGR